MARKYYASKCCSAFVKIEGRTTNYHVCTKCNKATDVKEIYKHEINQSR